MEKRLISLLRLAIKNNVSDIHLTLNNTDMKIEMRMGDCLKLVKLDQDDHKLIRYLQYISKMDIGNNIKPQTGQFNLDVDDYSLSIRFACMYNLNIVNGVIRILNTKLNLSVKTLSKNDKDYALFQKAINYKEGLIVFCGPTGSGKTTSLYTLLNSVKNRKIISIEDPIEIYNENFLQLQINDLINFDYDQAIKQILRHDPDIVMIGEIRDEVAAKAALRAANTGHLVMTSIHAQNPSIAINRLIDLGLDTHMLKSILKMIFNQRLKQTSDFQKSAIYEVMDEDNINEYFKIF